MSTLSTKHTEERQPHSAVDLWQLKQASLRSKYLALRLLTLNCFYVASNCEVVGEPTSKLFSILLPVWEILRNGAGQLLPVQPHHGFIYSWDSAGEMRLQVGCWACMRIHILSLIRVQLQGPRPPNFLPLCPSLSDKLALPLPRSPCRSPPPLLREAWDKRSSRFIHTLSALMCVNQAFIFRCVQS